MAKKQTKAAAPEVEAVKEVEEVIVKKPVAQPKVKKPSWEIKDRVYYLKGNKKPLSHSIRSAGVFWFDEEKGYERELKYCQNQKTPFVDEMQGEHRLSHIVFRGGNLYVPKEKTVLQKLLSLYHPDRDRLYYEHKPVKIAETQLDWLEFEIEALNLARSIDIDLAEAIMRAEVGSNVSEMRNFGIKATEAGIIRISADQRNFVWGSNDRKLMTIPFDEHPYSALAAWFKTDEGMEVYSNIEKRSKGVHQKK